MIWISKTSNGLLLQKDGTEIAIDAAAISLALGPIIHELVDAGHAIGAARLEGYEAGLTQGRTQERIEAETRARTLARTEMDAVEVLAQLALSPLAA